MTVKSPTPPRDMKKFLFDTHNFDEQDSVDDDLGDIEVAPPPPPVFSEGELADAQAQSYEQGKRDGLAEALNSFELQIAETLAAIRDHFSILFDAEDRRNRTFEKEAVQLAYTVFAKAFPALNEKHGMEEVKKAVTSILETVREQPELLVDVPAAYVETIQHHIDGLLRVQGGPRCLVRAHENLGVGQCKISWVNGSAIRNAPALVEQIQEQIEHLLADKANLADNEGTDPVIPSSATTDDGERND